MSYTPNPINQEAKSDAGGRTRISQMTTLFDGKTTTIDDSLIYENVGTGTGTFQTNKFNMSVTAGQYLIRRGIHITPYFSGKSHLVELTFDNFDTQTGVVKTAGYFNSDIVAPYTAELDGFWLENDGTTFRLKVSNLGVIVADIPIANWNNATAFSGYNWNNFTVVLFDFLWLGGATLRMFIKTDAGFILAHTYNHASNAQDVMIASPNHAVRYEIRSSTGAGSFRPICCQIASEGSIDESGKSLAIFNSTAYTTNTVGTIYALKGIKKSTVYRDLVAIITSIGSSNTGVADAGILMLILDPTLSTPITYTAKSKILEGTPTAGTTVTPNTGRVIHIVPSGVVGSGYGLNDSYLSAIGMLINSTSSELVLAYMPTTATQSVYGTITMKEY